MTAIVVGKPGESEVVARIEAEDEAEVMPPPSAKKPLTADQKKLLRLWIEQGAEYAQHWAFVPPRRPDVPRVKNSAWPRNNIDRFVLKRLEEAGLAPAPEADKGTLLRRVTLDLTGLPPTLKELDDFLADRSEGAYERVVDRLLDSPRYGEKMAMQWLDAARYADTNGYNNDEERTMWPWRDWVIRVFNANMPFDRFLTEQLAGDLLPDPTLEQRIATGFNRNHVLTTEGGIIDEEYRVEYVVDRVHTTATVVMGLSMQCARCHDHKYDPISQREYYQFFAFFNNVADKSVNYNQGGVAEPYLKAPTAEQQQELARLAAQKETLEKRMADRKSQADGNLADWERSLTAEEKQQLSLSGQTLRVTFDETEGDRVLPIDEGKMRKTLPRRLPARSPARPHGNRANRAMRWPLKEKPSSISANGASSIGLTRSRSERGSFPRRVKRWRCSRRSTTERRTAVMTFCWKAANRMSTSSINGPTTD